MQTVKQNKLWILGGLGAWLLYKSQLPELDRISQTEFQHRINTAQIHCNVVAQAYYDANPNGADMVGANQEVFDTRDKLKQTYFKRFGSPYPE